METRRKNDLFSFDYIMCHAWTVGSDAWLKPDDSDENSDDDSYTGDDSDRKSSTLPPMFHQNPAKSGTLNDTHIGDYFGKEDINRDICTDNNGVFHSIPITYSNLVSCADGCGGIYDPEKSGTNMEKCLIGCRFQLHQQNRLKTSGIQSGT